MKNYFNFDFVNKTIVGSNASIKRANSGSGSEYRELCQKLAEHPNFSVVAKSMKTNHEKKKYNGLTIKKMKEYISTQSNSKEQLKIFEKVQEVAEAKGAKYPLTKKWFLKTYPEYKDNDTFVSDAEAAKIAEAEIEEIEAEPEENVA